MYSLMSHSWVSVIVTKTFITQKNYHRLWCGFIKEYCFRYVFCVMYVWLNIWHTEVISQLCHSVSQTAANADLQRSETHKGRAAGHRVGGQRHSLWSTYNTALSTPVIYNAVVSLSYDFYEPCLTVESLQQLFMKHTWWTFSPFIH